VQLSEDGQTAKRWSAHDVINVMQHHKEDAAALALPVLDEGIFRLTFAVKGDAVVGVASALSSQDEWDAKAWGLSTVTGCLHYASSPDQDGMPGVEIAPQRQIDDDGEALVHFELDLDELTIRSRMNNDPWRALPVRLPAAVRPWVLFPAGDTAGLVRSEAKLLACEQKELDLHVVRGLRSAVGHLSSADQRRALAWCEDAGFFEVAAIEPADARELVDAIGCRRSQADETLRRLARLRAA